MATGNYYLGWCLISSGARHRNIVHEPNFSPPYSSELNPAERIFEEVRREIEGFVYPSLKAKQHHIDQFLRRFRADKQRFASLISWDWINDIFNQLPNHSTLLFFT